MLQLQLKRPLLLGDHRQVREQPQHRHLLALVQPKMQLLQLQLQPQLQ
jgi:hypothetical protein